jgi:hypothetical protein
MENSIFISSSHLLIVIGEYRAGMIRLEGIKAVPLPAEVTFNGIIADTQAMTDFVATIISEYGISGGQVLNNALTKNPSYLTIHTNSIQTKTIEVPPVSEEQTKEFIKLEFEQFSNEGSTDLVDYTVINPHLPSGGVEILAVVVSKEQIEAYRDSFVHAGIDLKGINVGVNSLIKLVRLLPQLQNQSFMLSNVDQQAQTISLFIEGAFRFSNRYRLVNQENTAEWIAETAKNLSTVLQFSKAQRGYEEVKTVYFAGLADVQVESLAAEFENVGITIKRLDLSGLLDVSANLLDNSEFNLERLLFNFGNFVKI